jgi:hypothetical protein
VAIVDAPDATAAISKAIEEENVPPNERGSAARKAAGLTQLVSRISQRGRTLR